MLIMKYINLVPTLLVETTPECNLQCKYCYRKNNEIIKDHINETRIIKLIMGIKNFQNEVKEKECLVIFFGGEPLLGFNLIDKITGEFKSNKIRFGIQTNGTLLNRQIISFLKERNIMLSISYDGLPIINDANRIFPNGRGSSEIIINKIRLLVKEEMEFGVLSIVNSMSVKNTKNILDHICSLGIKNISFLPLHSVSNCITGKEYAIFLLDCLSWLKNNSERKLIIRELKAWAYNLFLSSPYLCGAGLQCPATRSLLYLDANGKIWACPERKMKTLLRMELKSSKISYQRKCLNCRFKLTCKMGCPVRFNGNYCEFIEIFVPNFLSIVKNDEKLIHLLLGVDNE